MRKTIYVSLFTFFILIAIFSGMMIYRHFQEATEQANFYENLAHIVQNAEANTNTDTAPPSAPSEESELVMLPEYAELYAQNNDLVGWICVEDTKINYPVMQSLSDPNWKNI